MNANRQATAAAASRQDRPGCVPRILLAAAPRVPPIPRMAGLALIVSAIFVFYLGILPTRVLDLAAKSIATIL